MAVGDVHNVVTSFQSNRHNWSTSLDYEDVDGVSDEAASQDLLAAFVALAEGVFKSVVSNETILQSVYVRRRLGTPAMPALFQFNNVAGTGGVGTMPSISSAVYLKKSDDPALVRPGRMFVSGLPKPMVTDGALTAAYLAAAAPLIAFISLTLTGTLGQWRPVVYQRLIGPGPPYPFNAVPIQTSSVSTIVFSQRSRKSKYRGTGVAG